MKKNWLNKIKFFIKRYLFAEVVSAVVSYLLAWIVIIINDDKLISSYFGSVGAFIGFYAIIYTREYKKFPKDSDIQRNQIHRIIISSFLIEFGLSEIVDLFISRPFCLYLSQIFISSFSMAIIAGSIAANILFFAISAFMFSKRDAVFQVIRYYQNKIFNK